MCSETALTEDIGAISPIKTKLKGMRYLSESERRRLRAKR